MGNVHVLHKDCIRIDEDCTRMRWVLYTFYMRNEQVLYEECKRITRGLQTNRMCTVHLLYKNCKFIVCVL